MKKNKVIAVIVATAIFSLSFMGLLRSPERLDLSSSFRLIKTVMPFPGKTVLVINRYLRNTPKENHAGRQETKNDSEHTGPFSGILFYLLGAVFACTERGFLVLFFIAAYYVSVRLSEFQNDKRYGVNHVLPDLSAYIRWRFKFITPMEKCILNRSDQYDINPILNIRQGAVCT